MIDPDIMVGEPLSDQVAAVAYPNPTQGIPNSSVETLSLDVAKTEHSDVFTVDTANDRVTVNIGGTYLVHVVVKWSADATNWATGDRAEINAIQVNGATETAPRGLKIGTATQSVREFAVLELDPGDHISAELYQESGDAQYTSGNSNSTRLEVIRLG